MKILFSVIMFLVLSVSCYAQNQYNQTDAYTAMQNLQNYVNGEYNDNTVAQYKNSADNSKSNLDNLYSAYLVSNYASDWNTVESKKYWGDVFYNNGVGYRNDAVSPRNTAVTKELAAYMSYTVQDWDNCVSLTCDSEYYYGQSINYYHLAVDKFYDAQTNYFEAFCIIRGDANTKQATALTKYTDATEYLSETNTSFTNISNLISNLESAMEEYEYIYGWDAALDQAYANYLVACDTMNDVLEMYNGLSSYMDDVTTYKGSASTYASNNPTEYVEILNKFGYVLDGANTVYGNCEQVSNACAYSTLSAEAAFSYIQ